MTATVMEPRTFAISVDVAPAAGGGTQDRANVLTSNSSWWVWTQNGTSFKGHFGSLFPTIEFKLRCQNTSNADVSIVPTVVADPNGDGAITLASSGDFGTDGSFVVPANGGVLVESVNAGDPITGTIGPLVASFTGTQPVRVAVELIALTATTNIGCVMVTPSPVGVLTFLPMDRVPQLPH